MNRSRLRLALACAAVGALVVAVGAASFRAFLAAAPPDERRRPAAEAAVRRLLRDCEPSRHDLR